MSTAAFFFGHWLFHPLVGRGYQFWSGIAGCFVSIGLFGGLGAWYHQHNCHEPRCPRLQWHPHPDHGHPVCKKHHRHPTGAL